MDKAGEIYTAVDGITTKVAEAVEKAAALSLESPEAAEAEAAAAT